MLAPSGRWLVDVVVGALLAVAATLPSGRSHVVAMIVEAATTIVNVQRRLLQLLAVVETIASNIVLVRFTAVVNVSLLAATGVHVGLVIKQRLLGVLIVEVVVCEVRAHVYLIVVLLFSTISLLHVVVIAEVHV